MEPTTAASIDPASFLAHAAPAVSRASAKCVSA